jgi:hypothetical protein
MALILADGDLRVGVAIMPALFVSHVATIVLLRLGLRQGHAAGRPDRRGLLRHVAAVAAAERRRRRVELQRAVGSVLISAGFDAWCLISSWRCSCGEHAGGRFATT